MSVHPEDIKRGIEVLREFGARRVWVFGSSLDSPAEASDLDLACEGVPPQRFYRAVGKLLDVVGKPVDLVDFDTSTPLTNHIRKTARLVYEIE